MVSNSRLRQVCLIPAHRYAGNWGPRLDKNMSDVYNVQLASIVSQSGCSKRLHDIQSR